MSTSSRLRKRPVSFGNPALGTYQGFVYTIEASPPSEGEGRLDGSTYQLDNHHLGGEHCSLETLGTSLPKSAQRVERMIAMVDVPPDQVPEGILNVARSHRSTIEHVRIMIAEPNMDDRFDTRSTGQDDPPQRSYLILFRVSTEDDAITMAADLDGRPYTTLDETVTCRVYPVVALEGEGGVSLVSPVIVLSTKSLVPSPSNGDDRAKATERETELSTTNSTFIPNVTEDLNCAVCLEHMPVDQSGEDRTSYLTTVCNHTFHLDCIVRCQDSPCPVCRYDHSGLNDALSQCSICGTTDRNYVCLICGVVSCVNGGSGSREACASSTSQTNAQQQSFFTTSHATQHYDETLHAYALDTETQHVWDFAGQGYVHRLLQNKEDGKLVEVSDPHNTTSQERSMTPGLSDAQEGEVVHRKLEGFASQYHTLLKSQLEQQRSFYEGRLEEIRREFSLKKKHATAEKGDFISALKQEKKQLSTRLMTIKRKTQKVTEDISFLENMNESLQTNKGPLLQRITEAQQEQAASREMLLRHLPALEEKVTALMLQLTEGETRSSP